MVSFVLPGCTVSSWLKYAPAANGTVMKSEKSCPVTNRANGGIITENIVICVIDLTQKKPMFSTNQRLQAEGSYFCISAES